MSEDGGGDREDRGNQPATPPRGATTAAHYTPTAPGIDCDEGVMRRTAVLPETHFTMSVLSCATSMRTLRMVPFAMRAGGKTVAPLPAVNPFL